MRERTWLVLALGALLLMVAGCGDEGGDDKGTDPEEEQMEESGHAIHLTATLTPDDAESITFLTPSANLYTQPVSDVVGKPYFVATFIGGAEQGVDDPLHIEWGEVGEDLVVRYSSPSMFDSGPYDVILVVYTQTPVSIDPPPEQALVPVAGELSSFTLSTDEIHEGDPAFANGFLRVNVDEGDASVEIGNYQPSDEGVTPQDFVNTVLTVP